jgi:hypothetical protein
MNERIKIDKFDQFLVTCFNKTKVNQTHYDDSTIYERAFAGFAKQKVIQFLIFHLHIV